MRILFYEAGSANSDAWLDALRAELPQAQLRVWREGDDEPADYAVAWRPPLEMLRPRPGLKAVFNIAAGVDAILKFGDALPKGVPLVRLDDAGMAIQMAEYVSHAVLRYFRRFDEYAGQARERSWRRLEPNRKEDFPVGILGLGVLGSRVAAALAHFGFPLHGWSRSKKDLEGVHCHAGAEGLDEFLRSVRVVVCLLPLTAETTGLLNRATLSRLPRGSYLINVARGAHVVEQDLLELVRQGHIAGATLDVFGEEPLPPAHPFWDEPRITITPHISALTLRHESARQIADKIRKLERGEAIAGIVDLARGY